eukprot:scaffold785_cov335-Pavlova_lutheri.AAC.1
MTVSIPLGVRLSRIPVRSAGVDLHCGSGQSGREVCRCSFSPLAFEVFLGSAVEQVIERTEGCVGHHGGSESSEESRHPFFLGDAAERAEHVTFSHGVGSGLFHPGLDHGDGTEQHGYGRSGCASDEQRLGAGDLSVSCPGFLFREQVLQVFQHHEVESYAHAHAHDGRRGSAPEPSPSSFFPYALHGVPGSRAHVSALHPRAHHVQGLQQAAGDGSGDQSVQEPLGVFPFLHRPSRSFLVAAFLARPRPLFPFEAGRGRGHAPLPPPQAR